MDYKLFKSSATWSSFETSRKIKPAAYDFAAGNLLILVSVSDFPAASSVSPKWRREERNGGEVPRQPAGDGGRSLEDEQREAYARVMVPRGVPVRLEQVP